MEEKKIYEVPFWKSLLAIYKLMDNPIPIILDQMEQINDDTYWVHLGLSMRTLITRDVEIVQHVLQKNHRNYKKSKIQSELLAKYIGKGLLTSNGDYWLQQRRLIQPGFHKAHLESFMQIMNEEIILFVENWKQKFTSASTEIEITEQMSALTIRVVSKALFSSDIKEDEIGFIAHSVDTLQGAVIKDIRQPFFNWFREINGSNTRHSKIAHKLYALLQDKIDQRRQSKQTHGDLLQMLLDVRYEETGRGMTDQQLIDEILILYAAGYETTANGLSWLFYLLAQNPEHKKNLVDEIKRVDLPEALSFEHLRNLPFSDMVISETLRLYPPAWIMDRQAIESDEINGIKIEKGGTLNLFLYGVHHNAMHWENPEEFNPWRFDRSQLKSKTIPNYFPFGSGPRMCIGFQFAKMEMLLSVYHIFKSFDLKKADKQKVSMYPMVTLKPKGGIKMNLSQKEVS